MLTKYICMNVFLCNIKMLGKSSTKACRVQNSSGSDNCNFAAHSVSFFLFVFFLTMLIKKNKIQAFYRLASLDLFIKNTEFTLLPPLR